MGKISEIIVVFKTHFDLGYTDFAKNVLAKYRECYIPQALERAREMHGEQERFIWTTGSWLITDYLENAPEEKRRQMEQAIADGDIVWHALPLTTHTELMDEELFRYGLSLAKALDQRFGRKTIAAKMTDVPGHTKAILPILAQAGIEFMHIGVNPVSVAPDVPPLFVWRDEEGNELTVMYSFGYGDYQEIGDTGAALMFAHTGDNNGPPDANALREMFADLHRRYPDAAIRAGTLDDVALLVRGIKAKLPVVTSEIGDSWIHGAASDPGKVSRYRALLRARRQLDDEDRRRADQQLLLIPEHTWGLDYKSRAKDTEHFDAAGFARVIHSPSYERMAQSWQEQRDYLEKAADSVTPEAGVMLRQAMAECAPQPFHADEGWMPVEAGSCFEVGESKLSFNAAGAINRLVIGGREFASDSHCLAAPLYEIFSGDDMERYNAQYVDCSRFPGLKDLARDDFFKVGAEKVVKAHRQCGVTLDGLYRKGASFAAVLRPASETLVKEFGCPAKLVLRVTLKEREADISLDWFDKQPTRVPEALWLGFHPLAQGVQVRKLSRWIDLTDVVSHGGRRIHATDWGVRYQSGVQVESADCAVVNVGEPHLWNFDDTLPGPDDGVWFCLCNNMWNTNFPLWYGENARFRFRISVTE